MAKIVHDWDRPLSVAEIEALSPAAKGARSRAALSRKLAVLESWLTSVDLLKANVERIPWSRPQLRKWHDEPGKLWSWKNSQVDLPGGRNADLITRYFRILGEFRKQIDGETDEKDAEIALLVARVKELEKQNLRLLDQILRLQSLLPA